MDLSRFKALSEAYGAERRRWSEAARPLYDRFAGTLEGAAVLAQAESVDRFLDALEVSAPMAQKLYIIPSRNLVVVRQASRSRLWGWGFEDAGFLAPILKKMANPGLNTDARRQPVRPSL